MGNFMNKTEFGKFIRDRRINHLGVTLRGFSVMIGVSPTYVSKIERGEFDPPSEGLVKRMAERLGVNKDVLLAMAGRVDSELQEIIRRNPVEMAELIRYTNGLLSEVEKEKWGK